MILWGRSEGKKKVCSGGVARKSPTWGQAPRYVIVIEGGEGFLHGNRMEAMMRTVFLPQPTPDAGRHRFSLDKHKTANTKRIDCPKIDLELSPLCIFLPSFEFVCSVFRAILGFPILPPHPRR
jgi:hypothetical protein